MEHQENDSSEQKWKEPTYIAAMLHPALHLPSMKRLREAVHSENMGRDGLKHLGDEKDEISRHRLPISLNPAKSVVEIANSSSFYGQQIWGMMGMSGVHD